MLNVLNENVVNVKMLKKSVNIFKHHLKFLNIFVFNIQQVY